MCWFFTSICLANRNHNDINQLTEILMAMTFTLLMVCIPLAVIYFEKPHPIAAESYADSPIYMLNRH